MSSKIFADLKEKIKHWEKRRDELADWLVSHSYEDTNYNQNQSDYNHAVIKVQQLTDRLDRELNGPRDVGQSYAMPTSRIKC